MHNIDILITTKEQLITIINIDYIRDSKIYIESQLAYDEIDFIKNNNFLNLYICDPHIMRNENINFLADLLETNCFKGILIRNLETFAYLNFNYDRFSFLEIILDSSLYILNNSTLDFFADNSKFKLVEYYNSLELNMHEIEDLYKKNKDLSILASNVIYGKAPLMISANCVKKTNDDCNNNPEFYYIKDRMNKSLPIYSNCLYCYNVIYNNIPTSLHKFYDKLMDISNVRIDFTNEDSNQVVSILEYFYLNIREKNKIPFDEYTNGLYKRGVE